MKIKQLHTAFFLSLCAALAACSDQDALVEDPSTGSGTDSGKTPIELSVGGVEGSATRAVITDGKNSDDTNKSLNNFTKKTRLFLYVKSEDGSVTPTATKYALTHVSALVESGKEGTIDTPTDHQLYWDDAHARDSKVTVYACAVANSERESWTIGEKKYGKGTGDALKYNFNTETINTTFEWKVGDNHNYVDQNDFEKGDLVFSNNIASHSSSSDKRLIFHNDTRKFDKGNLIFYHALSKVTFHVVMGEGFTESDFKFAENKNIALNGFLGSGTFDLAQGEFTSTAAKKFDYIAPENKDNKLTLKTDGSKKYYELNTYVVPGTDLTTPAVADAVTMVINGNTYKVTMKTLYDRILANPENQEDGISDKVKESVLTGGTKLKAGVNYLFTIIIDKAKINNISAKVVDWETVTSENILPSNAYVKLSLKTDEGTAVDVADPKVDLYRAKDPTSFTSGSDYNSWSVYKWETGYTGAGNKATLTQSSEDNSVYSAKDAAAVGNPQWFWPDNATFYHFRTINKGLTVATENNIDYVNIYSGKINDNYSDTDIASSVSDVDKFNDYLWGAPFKSEAPTITVYSSTYGFCNNATPASGQIYKAIGATSDNIMLIQHHMMSNIYVGITTSNDSDPDKVDLSNTTVKLVRYAKSAKLQMGNGLITGYDNYDTGTGTELTKETYVVAATAQHPAYGFTYRVVPQSMTYSSAGANTKLGLEITTNDGNVYKIDLSEQKITDTDNKITEWLPGKKYYYTFKLSKYGITNISATVVDWENVVAAEDDVQIQ